MDESVLLKMLSIVYNCSYKSGISELLHQPKIFALNYLYSQAARTIFVSDGYF